MEKKVSLTTVGQYLQQLMEWSVLRYVEVGYEIDDLGALRGDIEQQMLKGLI